MDIKFKQLESLGHTKFESLIPGTTLQLFEEILVELYGLQACKIGDFRNEALKTLGSNLSNFEKFCNLYELLEKSIRSPLSSSKVLTSIKKCT